MTTLYFRGLHLSGDVYEVVELRIMGLGDIG
jgi:hypothetical protein